VDHLKNVGDRFRKGEVLAIVRGIDGVEERAKVAAHFDGWIVAWNNGVRSLIPFSFFLSLSLSLSLIFSLAAFDVGVCSFSFFLSFFVLFLFPGDDSLAVQGHRTTRHQLFVCRSLQMSVCFSVSLIRLSLC
jgi:hypothetical protein